MKKLLVPLLIVGGIILVIGGYLVSTYNSLVVLDQEVSNKQAQVEVVLQRRFDLIPNLVNATKGFLTQEQKVFSDIADARTKYAGSASGSSEKLDAANQLESSLARLLVIVENYPTLKSDQTIRDLMTELAGTENRIAVERQRFNDTASGYNVKVRSFPTNILAGMFGFEKRTLFESTPGASVAPTVSL
jgi:LemA protein